MWLFVIAFFGSGFVLVFDADRASISWPCGWSFFLMQPGVLLPCNPDFPLHPLVVSGSGSVVYAPGCGVFVFPALLSFLWQRSLCRSGDASGAPHPRPTSSLPSGTLPPLSLTCSLGASFFLRFYHCNCRPGGSFLACGSAHFLPFRTAGVRPI